VYNHSITHVNGLINGKLGLFHTKKVESWVPVYNG